jgi:hypothetical protein
MGTVEGFTFDGRFSQNRASRDKQGRLWMADETEALAYRLDQSQRAVKIVSALSDSPTRVAVMRVVRELATTACLRDGLLPVHASAFVGEDGRATMICGPKLAGKTSLLVHALRWGAGYLANDRVMLEPAAPLMAHGMPTIVSLRAGMLDLFPGLKELLELSPTRRPEASVGLTPAKLGELYGSAMVERAPLGLLLFPRVDQSIQGLRFEPLPPEECAPALRKSLLRASHPIASSEAFLLGERREVLEPGLEAEACRRVADKVPAFACLVGEGAFDSAPGWPESSPKAI